MLDRAFRSDLFVVASAQWNQKRVIHPALRCPHKNFLPVHRKWAHLAMKVKATTLTNGWFSVGGPCGGAKRPCASGTRPLTRCCRWRGSSTGGPSTVRWRCTPCRDPANTACGRPWKASLWSPARTRRAADTTATHTPSSDLDISPLLLSLPIFLSVYRCIPTSVPNHTCTSTLVLTSSSHLCLLLTFFNLLGEETVPKSVTSQGTLTSSLLTLSYFSFTLSVAGKNTTRVLKEKQLCQLVFEFTRTGPGGLIVIV